MRVLILDDNEELRGFLALALTEAGEDAVAIGDADEATTRLAEGSFDVFVVDSVLSDTDGVAIVQQLRNLPDWRDLKVVLMSPISTSLARRVAKAAGCDEFLVKPFGPQQLVESVKKLAR
jgi:two-component system, chemotaxis family, chemotaxis protein CheY